MKITDPDGQTETAASRKDFTARVGILSAGRTEMWREEANALGVGSIEDLPAPFHPVDHGLIQFLSFFNRISRPTQRKTRFSVIGNIKDVADFLRALNQMVDSGVELVVWWTITVPVSGMDAGITAIIEKAVTRAVSANTILVYPCFSGPVTDAAGVIPVGGVVAGDPYLALCPAPQDRQLITPKLVSWGDWNSFRMSWMGAGYTDGIAEESPNMNEHSLAVWSIAATLGLSLNRRTPDKPRFDPEGAIQRMSVPVELRPKGARARYGHFDPRYLLTFERR